MKKLRGYTLVEIAIVLTIATMMASWVLVSYFQWQTNAHISETERSIDAIKESLVNYAARNTSYSFDVVGSSTGAMYWRVPGSRPYLPCPDVTGDGFEDRQPKVKLPAGAAVTLAMGSYGDARAGGTVVARGYGHECYRYRGLVPWKTLGAPAADAWGNRFTYRVDPKFAHSLLGFDQETRSDDGVDYANLTVAASGGVTMVMRRRVLTPDEDVMVMGAGGATIVSEAAPSLVCARAPCSFEAYTMNMAMVAGTVAAATVVGRGGGFDVPVRVETKFVAGNVVSGLPVVIVSHGRNGYGAVRADAVASGDLRCHSVAPASEGEKQNAFVRSASAKCAAVAPAGGGRSNGFVSRAPVHNGFDDVVAWMSAEELARRLVARGVFPAEQLPPVGMEGY